MAKKTKECDLKGLVFSPCRNPLPPTFEERARVAKSNIKDLLKRSIINNDESRWLLDGIKLKIIPAFLYEYQAYGSAHCEISTIINKHIP